MKKALFNAEPIQAFTVRIPIPHYKKLRHMAIDKDISLADLVRKIISDFITEFEAHAQE